MTEIEKMEAGLEYRFTDRELGARRRQAIANIERYNRIPALDHPLTPLGRRNRLGVTKPIHIGNDVWIGGGAVILPGVNIGNNVVVGAGAVVTHDIPDNSLALGVPARVVREIDNDLDGWVEGKLLQ